MGRKKKIKTLTEQRSFVMVYKDFLESNLLDTPYQKLLYIYLKKFADSNNVCFPSVKTLSDLTKISKTKIKETLKELEKKGVLSIKARSKDNGGDTSNTYTLYDYAEIWNINGDCEDVSAVADKLSEAKMIAELRKKGYTVTKEKVPNPSAIKQSTDESSTNKNTYQSQDTSNNQKSQEKYSLDVIKKRYEYSIMIERQPLQKDNIDSIISILYDTLNTSKPTIRIDSENKPTDVVVSKLLKLSCLDILYAIEQFEKQTNKIKNVKAYVITLLYNAKEQSHLDITNQVQHDMYGGLSDVEELRK